MSMGQGGIFGNPRVRRGRMGSIEPVYDDMNRMIPGMGDMQAMDGPQTQPKPKFFGQGGAGRAIAGTIGDALLQMSGMQPIYGPMMQDRQAIAAQEQAMMRKRAWELEDARNKPPAYDEFGKQLIQAGIQPGTPEWSKAYSDIVMNRRDPILQTTQTTDAGTFLTGVRASQLMGGAGSSVPAAGTVVADPRKSGGVAAMQGVPAPSVGPSGVPATMTLQQYQAIVQTKGKPWTDQMIQRHGIQVTR